jgi:hypothetical protein
MTESLSFTVKFQSPTPVVFDTGPFPGVFTYLIDLHSVRLGASFHNAPDLNYVLRTFNPSPKLTQVIHAMHTSFGVRVLATLSVRNPTLHATVHVPSPDYPYSYEVVELNLQHIRELM